MCRLPGTAPLAGGQYPAQGFVSNFNWAGLDDVYNPPMDQAALDLITPSLSELVGSVGSLTDLGSGAADGEEVQQLSSDVHAGSPLFSSFPAGASAGVPSEAGRDWLASCLDVARLPTGSAGRIVPRPTAPQPAQFVNAPYLQQPAMPVQVKQHCEERSYNPSLAELQFQLATMQSRKPALDMCGNHSAFDSQTDADPLPGSDAAMLASWRHKKTPQEIEAQTERVKKRRRESARRSRQRKSSYIHNLEEENRLLKVENLELRIKLAQTQGNVGAAAAGQGRHSASASAGSN